MNECPSVRIITRSPIASKLKPIMMLKIREIDDRRIKRKNVKKLILDEFKIKI